MRKSPLIIKNVLPALTPSYNKFYKGKLAEQFNGCVPHVFMNRIMSVLLKMPFHVLMYKFDDSEQVSSASEQFPQFEIQKMFILLYPLAL